MKKLTIVCAVLCCCTLAFSGIGMKPSLAPAVKDLKAVSGDLLENNPNGIPLVQEGHSIGVVFNHPEQDALNRFGAERFDALQAPRVSMAASLAGGEDCGSATVIAALPFSDTGSTVGAVDDYDEVCPFTGSTSGDLVYSYTPAANMAIDVSLCDSLYDTKVYIYEGACPGTVVACNDDAGCGFTGYQSELEGVNLTAGSTYYIVVDGYGGATGDYVIDVVENVPCVVDCPVGANDETEACGDDLNGGCNMVDPAFTAIACGETFCGLSFGDAIRDTDWYELVITQTEWITLTVDAEFEAIVGIVETYTPGSGDCDDSTGYVSPYLVVEECETAVIEATLTPGTYWFFIAPVAFEYPCVAGPWDYTLDLACFECTDADVDGYSPDGGPCGDIDCDDDNALVNPGMDEVCEDGIDNDCDGDVDVDDADCPCSTTDYAILCDDTTSGDTSGGADELNGYSCTGLNESGPEDIYTLALAQSATVFVDVTNLSADLDLFVLDDFDGLPCAHNCLGYSGGVSDEQVVLNLEPGTYHIVIDGYGGNVGTYDLGVTCCLDNDGDGFGDEACGGPDCDDTDPAVYPGAEEICDDGIDNNCDGVTDDGYACVGFTAPITENPPTIDGILTLGEWDDAYAVDISASRAPVMLYMMVDEDFLYVAMDDQNTPALADYVQSGIYFDENNDDNWPEVDGEEGNFWLYWLSGVPETIFRGFYTDGTFIYFGAQEAPAPGVEGALSQAAGNVQHEWKIDWAASDLNASIGDSIGFYIYTSDGVDNTGVWAIDSYFAFPWTFFDVATCPDADGDDFTDAACGGDDCDDADALINPDAAEVCDDVDNDCNAATADGSAEAWLNAACDGADSDLCEEGVFLCTAGVQTCNDNTGDTREAYLARNCRDGVDNDCDDMVDVDPECVGNCGCAAFDTSGAPKAFQIAASGLIYLLPLGFVLVTLRRFRR